MCIVEFTGHLLSDRDTSSSTGMGAAVNGNNQWEWEGNGNKTRLNLGVGMGMGINHWEWERMGLKKIFPLISIHRPRHQRSVVVDHSSRYSTRPRCDRRQPAHVGIPQRCVPVGNFRQSESNRTVKMLSFLRHYNHNTQCACLYVYSRQDYGPYSWNLSTVGWVEFYRILPNVSSVGFG